MPLLHMLCMNEKDIRPVNRDLMGDRVQYNLAILSTFICTAPRQKYFGHKYSVSQRRFIIPGGNIVRRWDNIIVFIVYLTRA